MFVCVMFRFRLVYFHEQTFDSARFFDFTRLSEGSMGGRSAEPVNLIAAYLETLLVPAARSWGEP